MAIIEPLRHNPAQSGQIKKYSAPLRLWHWLSVVIITGLLLTVLINSTLLKRHNITPLIQNELKAKGIKVDDNLAGSVGHALSDRVWDLHIYFGYALAILLLFRLVLEFFQVADQKFIRKLQSAYIQFRMIKKSRELLLHEMFVKAIYAIFYVLLIIMVFTGLFLAFEDFMAPYKAIRHTIKSVHGFCMYLILAFITIHLAGVFLAERKEGKGIVSDMINGGGGNIYNK